MKTRSRLAGTNEKRARFDFVSASEACAWDELGKVSQVCESECLQCVSGTSDKPDQEKLRKTTD
jgi:hypothetical protein